MNRKGKYSRQAIVILGVKIGISVPRNRLFSYADNGNFSALIIGTISQKKLIVLYGTCCNKSCVAR